MIIYTKETFQQELEWRFPNEQFEVLDFSGAFKPITYKCLKCGKIYNKSRANHLYENQFICKPCNYDTNSKARKWILDFFDKTNNFTFAAPWSGKTNENIVMQCKKCSSVFSKQPYNLYLKNEETICPTCGHNGAKKDVNYFLNKLSDQERKDFTILKFSNMTSSMTIRHSCGFVFSQLPANFLKSKGCPKCNKTMSAGELMVKRFLDKKGIAYESQKRFSDLHNFLFDFYLPDNNVIIEYNGQQHYSPTEHFGGEERFKTQQQRDKLKQEYAINNHIRILYIPYTIRVYADIELVMSSFLSSTTSLIDVAPTGAKEKILQLCNNNIV